MTQEEAIIKALEDYGGRATTKQIYERVIQYALFGGKTPEATIRWWLQKSKFTKPTIGQRGWWELVSYQEEIAKLKAEIAHKDVVIAEKDNVIDDKDKEIEELRSQLGVTPSFERLATALMDKLSILDKEEKKEVRNIMIQLSSWLALSPRKDILERINGFLYEKPKAGEPQIAEAIMHQTEVNKNLAKAIKEVASRPTHYHASGSTYEDKSKQLHIDTAQDVDPKKLLE